MPTFSPLRIHGATVTVRPKQLRVTYSPLHSALGYEDVSLDIRSIKGVEVLHTPTALLCGAVRINAAQAVQLEFAPGDTEGPQALIDAVHAAQAGNLTVPGVAGLDFVAVDVETANPSWGSICQIGAAKVREGKIVETRSWYCQPPQGLGEFHPDNVRIHGITAEDVRDAMPFGKAYAEFVEFAAGMPLVAHNAQFDATALQRACQASGTEPQQAHFGCSLALARAANLEVRNHRLPTVAEHLGVELSQHHDACADAAAAAGIVVALARRAHLSGDLTTVCHEMGFAMGELRDSGVYPVLRHSTKTRGDVNLGAVPGPAAQARGSKDPAGTAGSAESSEPVANGSTASSAESGSAGDSGNSKQRRQGSRPRWDKVATPETIPDPNPDADPRGPLFQQHITLSGDFEDFDKGELWDAIAAQGGIIGKNVTKKTTILAVGSWDKKTSKQRRAEELQAKGQAIEIWSAQQLLDHLDLSALRPPF